jgi:hypothetical protein
MTLLDSSTDFVFLTKSLSYLLIAKRAFLPDKPARGRNGRKPNGYCPNVSKDFRWNDNSIESIGISEASTMECPLLACPAGASVLKLENAFPCRASPVGLPNRKGSFCSCSMAKDESIDGLINDAETAAQPPE